MTGLSNNIRSPAANTTAATIPGSLKYERQETQSAEDVNKENTTPRIAVLTAMQTNAKATTENNNLLRHAFSDIIEVALDP